MRAWHQVEKEPRDPNIIVAGEALRWRSVWHYFQAAKFGDLTRGGMGDPGGRMAAIRDVPEAERARELGAEGESAGASIYNKATWERMRDKVMMEALLEKVTQHPDVSACLAKTGKRQLVFEDPDPFWGGTRNRVGELLCEVRQMLRDEGTMPHCDTGDMLRSVSSDYDVSSPTMMYLSPSATAQGLAARRCGSGGRADPFA